MNSIYKFLSATVICCSFFLGARAQVNALQDIIQITGVTMTADSLRAVPDVTIALKSKDRGTYSNAFGVFSLVCSKGDTLNFSAVGYRTKEYVIPPDINGRYFNVVQLMVQDTFYLPETIIRPLPYGDEFDYAFKYWDIPDDQYATAQRNTNDRVMAYLRANLPKNGPENQNFYQAEQGRAGYYYGQQRPMNIFNPFKWGEFFNAWKRGDFKKK
ncbi:MAG: carboxypeptidase-like regulatory domain-containing protein [Sphingobacteriales bacterium]|nr:MAG: carboxypeptidase-like regulatory domain-containing protein [Sphingobacteriales bacterium]